MCKVSYLLSELLLSHVSLKAPPAPNSKEVVIYNIKVLVYSYMCIWQLLLLQYQTWTG